MYIFGSFNNHKKSTAFIKKLQESINLKNFCFGLWAKRYNHKRSWDLRGYPANLEVLSPYLIVCQYMLTLNELGGLNSLKFEVILINRN